jgi:two-component system sensor histidine kinase TctE
MKLYPQTLRTRLVIWFLVPSMLVWGIGSYWVYETTLEASSYSYDYTLSTTLDAISYRVKLDNGKITVDFPTQIIPVLRERHVDKRFYQILDTNKKTIVGDDNLPEPPEFPTEVQLYNGTIDGLPVRIAAKRVVLSQSPPQVAYLQIAETLTGRLYVAAEAADRLLFEGAVMYIMLLLFTGYAVKRGLAPLSDLQRDLAQFTLEHSSKLEEQKAPEEIRPLIAAMNDLVDRVRLEFQRQKRFISNAAHQLRTPLAGLKVQAALALRDPNLKSISPTLSQIEKSLDNATNLINKMLTLASSEPGVLGDKAMLPVDLNEIARIVVRDLLARAEVKEIDLGLEESPELSVIIGIEWAVKELLSNLVENALVYSPPKSEVTVKVISKKERIELIVDDNGPGIPVEEREKIFERFYRLPNSPKGGSGLGLSIVQEVALAHKATITISTADFGKGARFIISFPRKES